MGPLDASLDRFLDCLFRRRAFHDRYPDGVVKACDACGQFVPIARFGPGYSCRECIKSTLKESARKVGAW